MVAASSVAIIVAAAFLPAIIFLVYVRNQEKTRREPWGAIISVFLFGAILSVLIALILEAVLHAEDREYELVQDFSVPSLVILVVVIAPIVEEFAKALGVRGARRRILEDEDGIVYGAAAGFGFAATENLFYELLALAEHGEAAFIATAVVRAFTGNFLHATATGIVGYGMGKMYRHGRGLFEVIPYYALAVLLHAAFNFVAVLNLTAAVGITLIFAFLAMRYTVHKIRRLDTTPTFAPNRGLP